MYKVIPRVDLTMYIQEIPKALIGGFDRAIVKKSLIYLKTFFPLDLH